MLSDTLVIDTIVAEARGTDCCFMFTIVEQHLHNYLVHKLKEEGIPYFDIMEPALQLIGNLLQAEPSRMPGSTNRLDEPYFARIDAIEFAVKYDDGKIPAGFLIADIVLIGVSRTSKTPLSMFLANRGYKVANLPIISGAHIPDELEQVPPERIIGLTIDPDKLTVVRKERLQDLRLPPSATYAQREHVEKELVTARALFERLGCKVLDVSNMAIEEAATRVIAHIEAV